MALEEGEGQNSAKQISALVHELCEEFLKVLDMIEKPVRPERPEGGDKA